MPAIPVNVRQNEGCQPQPVMFWDACWDPTIGYADWAYAGPLETLNRGGLKARRALDTAVILCLWTDRWCPPDHPLAKYIESSDPRGWWGDGIDVRADLGEAPLGSLLWLLERSVATPFIAQWAESLALEALSVMVGQMSVVRVDAQAQVAGISRIDLAIQLYGQDGTKIYAREFADIWNQNAQIEALAAAAPYVETLGFDSATPMIGGDGTYISI